MLVYVQALDYGKLLRINVESNEEVQSLKSKIEYELGDDVPEEIMDTISYLGVPLDSNSQLSTYNIRDSSLLYMGRVLIYQNPYQSMYPQQQQQQSQQQPQIQLPQAQQQPQIMQQQIQPQPRFF